MRWTKRAAAAGALLAGIFALCVSLSLDAPARRSRGGATAIGPAPAGTPGEIIPLADVRPGMKGYGLSVFSGTKIERFDVEVVSVLRKFYGDKDVILVRVGHPVTDHANVIAGMSGSPVYLEGRLAGAVALALAYFAKDPLAGVTPIEYMLADKAHPWEDEGAFIPPLPKDSPFQYCKTPLFAGGLPPAALKGLKDFMEPYGFTVLAGSAGQSDQAADARLEPGAAVGVTLLRGDIEMDGIGTVTHVSGKDVLVFGHSLFMGGQMELPMTTAYVHTVIASQERSYKLASSARPVGCVLKDRATSVYGVLGRTAPMIPLTVEVENPQARSRRTFRFEMGRHAIYTPYLLTQVPDYCLLLAEAGQLKDKTVRYSLRLKFEKIPDVELRDAYVSSPMGARERGFTETVFQLVGNPFRRVRLERADVRLSVVHRRTSATLDALWLQAQKIKPGDPLELTVRLRPYNGDPLIESVQIAMPRTVPDGEYEVTVMGGGEAGAAIDVQEMMRAVLSGRMPGQSQAQSFEELLDEIRRRHPADRIVARVDLPALGVRTKGRRLENLPSSVFVNLVSNPSAGIRLERDRLEVTRDVGWVVEGRKTAKFEIRTPGQVQPEQH